MAGDRGIKKIEFATDYDWAAKTGTFTEIVMSAVLLDGTQIAEPEEFSSEMADNIARQDGVRWSGVIRVELGTTTLPTENTKFHLKVTPYSGVAKAYGGTGGIYARILEKGLTSLSTGRPYIDIIYQFTAATRADGIQDA